MQITCERRPDCPPCPDASPCACLVLEWMTFLTGIEHLAEREARAGGRSYERCPDERLREIALLAAAQGRHPRAPGVHQPA